MLSRARLHGLRHFATSVRKRYFDEVAVKQLPELGGLYCLERRGKAVRIPGTERALAVPSAALAHAVLAEWRGDLPSETAILRVRDAEDPLCQKLAIPLTQLVHRAMTLSNDQDAREQTCKNMSQFVHSDALCYTDPRDAHVARLLSNTWLPFIEIANTRVNTCIRFVESPELTIRPQSIADEMSVFRFLQSSSPYWLAGAEHAVRISKSIVLALALERVSVDQASTAALAEATAQQRLQNISDAFSDLEMANTRRELALARVLMACESPANA